MFFLPFTNSANCNIKINWHKDWDLSLFTPEKKPLSLLLGA
jgi:hypothetical protein